MWRRISFEQEVGQIERSPVNLTFCYGRVFPTGVGVYRGFQYHRQHCLGFPHRRGGVPTSSQTALASPPFSPQAWGCTEYSEESRFDVTVFPTGVGVYRSDYFACQADKCFPHRRGGVPILSTPICTISTFSPQAWGVYRVMRSRPLLSTRFPHRRGGVPLATSTYDGGTGFSPQAWGCTVEYQCDTRICRVFPTGVGVYRATPMDFEISRAFSPQAWGCTAFLQNYSSAGMVFPTGVGVYRVSGFAVSGTVAFSPQAWGCTENE